MAVQKLFLNSIEYDCLQLHGGSFHPDSSPLPVIYIIHPISFFILHLVGRLSAFPPCFYSFAFQLNGEPPSLSRFHNAIKKNKTKQKKQKKKIPSCVRRDPCLPYRTQCQPFCPGMRGTEGGTERKKKRDWEFFVCPVRVSGSEERKAADVLPQSDTSGL